MCVSRGNKTELSESGRQQYDIAVTAVGPAVGITTTQNSLALLLVKYSDSVISCTRGYGLANRSGAWEVSGASYYSRVAYMYSSSPYEVRELRGKDVSGNTGWELRFIHELVFDLSMI